MKGLYFLRSPLGFITFIYYVVALLFLLGCRCFISANCRPWWVRLELAAYFMLSLGFYRFHLFGSFFFLLVYVCLLFYSLCSSSFFGVCDGLIALLLVDYGVPILPWIKIRSLSAKEGKSSRSSTLFKINEDFAYLYTINVLSFFLFKNRDFPLIREEREVSTCRIEANMNYININTKWLELYHYINFKKCTE